MVLHINFVSSNTCQRLSLEYGPMIQIQLHSQTVERPLKVLNELILTMIRQDLSPIEDFGMSTQSIAGMKAKKVPLDFCPV
jgi:hypothetical protein